MMWIRGRWCAGKWPGYGLCAVTEFPLAFFFSFLLQVFTGFAARVIWAKLQNHWVSISQAIIGVKAIYERWRGLPLSSANGQPLFPAWLLYCVINTNLHMSRSSCATIIYMNGNEKEISTIPHQKLETKKKKLKIMIPKDQNDMQFSILKLSEGKKKNDHLHFILVIIWNMVYTQRATIATHTLNICVCFCVYFHVYFTSYILTVATAIKIASPSHKHGYV